MNTSLHDRPAITAQTALIPVWKREPTLAETVLIWAVCALVFIAVASAFRPYMSLAMDFGDTSAYSQIAHAIASWNFSGIQVKQFWGVSYAVAPLMKVMGTSGPMPILIVCFAASLLSLLLAHRLWGGWIALFALMLNFDWSQRSFLGGSEPLFVALLFASFLMIRKERWLWAALLASLATITRPLGIFLLVGIAMVLLARRQWRTLALATFIGLMIGALYMLPLKLYLHDPLATVHSYRAANSGTDSALFGIPFYAIIAGTLRFPAPWTNLVLSFGWIALVLAGTVAMISTPEFRCYAREHPAEAIFAALYLLAIYSYNLPYWARGTFARFAIPILPFVFLALAGWLRRWLPSSLMTGSPVTNSPVTNSTVTNPTITSSPIKDRRVIWILAVASAALAACSALGIQNVLARLRG